jgi:hypothetical protein
MATVVSWPLTLLIGNGAAMNIQARDTFGGTSLEWTAFFGIPLMAELLIAAGAVTSN